MGTDHAGIATQNVVEKLLRTEGLTKEDLGREEFAKRVWAWRKEYGGNIIRQLKSLGCSCDYERERFTFDEGYVRAVTRVFVALYEKGYIYKDHYLVNWCPRCGTAISDLEVAYKDMPGTLNYIRYPVDGGGSVTIATTRPETMLGDTAVAVHPDDERYKDVVGKTATLPLLDRELRIVADERVDPAFGTGALKITPAHDLTDFDIGRTHGLETVQAIGQDGRITAAGGPYAGLEVEEAAERVVADLRALGVLEKVEDYPHSVATCDRCGTPIEPLISEQWFMRMDELKEPATDVVRDGKVVLHARALGPRVHRLDGEPAALVHQPPALVGAPAAGVVLRERRLPRDHRGGDRARGLPAAAAARRCAARPTCSTPGSARPCGRSPRGAGRTRRPDLAYFYPTNLLSTAREIIFLWVARMVMMGLEFMGDIPFSDVYIHSVIQAPDGRRMSKSLGTGIDPLEMIGKYGADATRFALLLMSSTQDVRFSEEKIVMGRSFANKLWNASRLVLLASEGYETARSDAYAGRPLDHEPLPARAWRRSRRRSRGTTSRPPWTRCTTSSGTSSATGTWSSSRCACTARTSRRRRRPPGTRAGSSARSCACCTRSCRSSRRRSRRSTARRRCCEQDHPLHDEALLSPADEAAVGELQAVVDALRRFRAEAQVPPGKVLSAVFVEEAGHGVAGAAERYAPYARRLPRAGEDRRRLRRATPEADGDRGARAGRPARGGGRRGQGRGDRPPGAAAREGRRPRSGAARPSSPTRASRRVRRRPWCRRSARSSPATSPTATSCGAPRRWPR